MKSCNCRPVNCDCNLYRRQDGTLEKRSPILKKFKAAAPTCVCPIQSRIDQQVPNEYGQTSGTQLSRNLRQQGTRSAQGSLGTQRKTPTQWSSPDPEESSRPGQPARPPTPETPGLPPAQDPTPAPAEPRKEKPKRDDPPSLPLEPKKEEAPKANPPPATEKPPIENPPSSETPPLKRPDESDPAYMLWKNLMAGEGQFDQLIPDQ